jgi:hypothetical protein
MPTAVQAQQYSCHLLPYVVMMPADKPWRQLLRTPSRRSSKNSTAAYSSYKATGTSRSYLNSSSPTLRASASLRVVRGEAIRRSSSNSEMESAEIALLADSCLTDIPRSLRTLFMLCSSGIEWRREGLPRPPSSRWWQSTCPTHWGVIAPLRLPLLPSGLRRVHILGTPVNTAHLGSSRRSESKVLSFELLTAAPKRAGCCG